MNTNPNPDESEPVFYCSGCDKDWGPDPQRRVGLRFVCPVSGAHFAAVVKPPAGKTWLKVDAWIRRLAKLSPMELVGGGGRAGLYHALRILVLAVCLMIAGSFKASVPVRILIAVTATYVLYDILVIATYATFVSRFPTHSLRSLMLTLSSLAEVGLGHAVFYVLLASDFNRQLSILDAVYFSAVTITTLGYGDIVPCSGASLVRLLILMELGLGLYILAGLVAVVATWANERPVPPTNPSLSDLLPKKD